MLFLAVLCYGIGAALWGFIRPNNEKFYSKYGQGKVWVWNIRAWRIFYGIFGAIWFVCGTFIIVISIHFFLEFISK
jgi:hypothetical protein